MSFFGDVPEPDHRVVWREERTREPDWTGPPENAIGATTAIDFVLVNTGDVAVAVAGMTSYPTGVSFSVHLVLREPDYDEDLAAPFFRPGGRNGGFRFGVAFADGRKATGDAERGRDAIVLTQRGGGGGGATWDQSFWLWPLPPPGPLTFACEWPARGIAETVHSVDSAPIREAAERAVELWPDDRPVAEYDQEW
jgi:hypothetical protein